MFSGHEFDEWPHSRVSFQIINVCLNALFYFSALTTVIHPNFLSPYKLPSNVSLNFDSFSKFQKLWAERGGGGEERIFQRPQMKENSDV